MEAEGGATGGAVGGGENGLVFVSRPRGRPKVGIRLPACGSHKHTHTLSLALSLTHSPRRLAGLGSRRGRGRWGRRAQRASARRPTLTWRGTAALRWERMRLLAI